MKTLYRYTQDYNQISYDMIEKDGKYFVQKTYKGIQKSYLYYFRYPNTAYFCFSIEYAKGFKKETAQKYISCLKPF